MPDTRCGWCGVHASMPFTVEPTSQVLDPGEQVWEIRVIATHKCAHCDCLSLSYAIMLEQELDGFKPRQGESEARKEHRFAQQYERLTWLPPPKAQLRYEFAPKEVADAAAEAHNCLAFGANRAAVQMARSVIEATAKERGITVARIQPKIEEMYKKGLIREYIRDGAHEIRLLGNDMSHGDFAVPVTAEDATLVLTLTHELLVEVYEGPGRVEQAKSRRAAREADGT